MNQLRSGMVEYRERAFEQDAAEAIKGDVVRALIELVTNCDDAYGRREGSISVVIEPTTNPDAPVRILVHDQAKGLNADAMRENFAVLGNEKSADEANERGLFGRGAKDVASIGTVHFRSIRDGKYSELQLKSDGHWVLQHEDVPANSEQRRELDVDASQNGLTVELTVRREVQVPSRMKLQDRLSKHAQLRDLVGRRRVLLADRRDKKQSSPVQLQPPDATGQVVVDEELKLDGYETVKLIVRKLPKRSPESLSPYSQQGLLVRSGVSTFENTWFDLEGRQEAAFFAGSVDAPEAAAIIRAYDKGDKDLGGPTRLLSRSRDGLIKEHPYRRALSAAISTRMKPLMDDLAQGLQSEKRQGEELNKALNVAKEAVRDHIRDVLEEIEDEVEGPGSDVVAPLALIPPRRVCAPNESITFTVRAAAIPVEGLRAEIEQDMPPETLTSIAVARVDWVQHERLTAVQKNIFVTAGETEGTSVIKASVDGYTAFATVVVREPSETDEPPPSGLEVDPESAKVAPGKRKRFNVRAPLHLEGTVVSVRCDPAFATVPEDVTLRAEPAGRWVQAPLIVEAGQARGRQPVYVWGAGEDVTAHLTIEDAPIRGGLDVDFELSGFLKPGRRSELTSELGVLKVRVYPLHPSFAGVFGKYSDEKTKFLEEDSAPARAVLAEVLANELAGFLTERDYDKRPDRLDDAPRVLRRRNEIAARLLTPLHRALRPQQ